MPVPPEVLLLADRVHQPGPTPLEAVVAELEVVALRVAAPVVDKPVHVQLHDERRKGLGEEPQGLGQQLAQLLGLPHDERLAVFAPGNYVVRPRVGYDLVRAAVERAGGGLRVQVRRDILPLARISRGSREFGRDQIWGEREGAHVKKAGTGLVVANA